jgi:hypothetical protein
MTISRLMFSETLQKLGPQGVVGIALLTFSLSLALSTLLPSWQELDRRRASAAAAQEKQRKAAARRTLPDDSPAALSLALSTHLLSWQELDRRHASAAAAQENQRKTAAQEEQPDDTPAALSLALSTLLPSWQELDRRRASAAAAQENQRKAAGTLSDDSPAAQLRAFYAIFPLQADAPASLSRVYAAAAEKNLQLLRGEYALSVDRQTGLVLYRMTLPVRGGYPQIREFVAAALKAVPTLALDELSFERPKISDTQVQTRIRLTLYLKVAS